MKKPMSWQIRESWIFERRKPFGMLPRHRAARTGPGSAASEEFTLEPIGRAAVEMAAFLRRHCRGMRNPLRMMRHVFDDFLECQPRRIFAAPIGQAGADRFGVFIARDIVAAEAAEFADRSPADVFHRASQRLLMLGRFAVLDCLAAAFSVAVSSAASPTFRSALARRVGRLGIDDHRFVANHGIALAPGMPSYRYRLAVATGNLSARYISARSLRRLFFAGRQLPRASPFPASSLVATSSRIPSRRRPDRSACHRHH